LHLPICYNIQSFFIAFMMIEDALPQAAAPTFFSAVAVAGRTRLSRLLVSQLCGGDAA